MLIPIFPAAQHPITAVRTHCQAVQWPYTQQTFTGANKLPQIPGEMKKGLFYTYTDTYVHT